MHDVVAHLVGVIEDGLAGRLSGPPDDAMTATEVRRHQHQSIYEMIDTWQRLAPMFEAAITERQDLVGVNLDPPMVAV